MQLILLRLKNVSVDLGNIYSFYLCLCSVLRNCMRNLKKQKMTLHLMPRRKMRKRMQHKMIMRMACGRNRSTGMKIPNHVVLRLSAIDEMEFHF